MLPTIDTRDAAAVEHEVRSIYAALYPEARVDFVLTAFGWVTDYFQGRNPDYLAIDAPYHDFEHTMQVTLCMARLLRGLHASGFELPTRAFELGIVAALFHETGYLKTRGDTEGTGAKYTAVHVGRGTAFAEAFLPTKGLTATEVRAVHNMIYCTCVSTDARTIPFQSELERTVGYALGTSDLLAQMAAPDYVEKLPLLYQEFAEAARNAPAEKAHLFAFKSADDLIRNSPAFWEGYVLPKVKGDFRGMYRFLADPYPDGSNDYLQRIEANIARLR